MPKIPLEENIVQILLQLLVFQGLNSAELSELLGRAKLVEVSSGTSIIQEGNVDEYDLYVCLSGHVQVRRRISGTYRTIRDLGPGECLGEMSLIDYRCRSASVVATQDSKFLKLNREEVEMNPSIAAKLYRNLAVQLSIRLRQANDTLVLG